MITKTIRTLFVHAVFFLGFVLSITSSLQAQVVTEKRVEFDLGEGFTSYSMTEFGDKGIMVYYRTEKYFDNKFTWTVEQYSTDIEKVISKEFEMDNHFSLSRSKRHEDAMYMYFVSKKNEYKLVQIEIEDLSVKIISGKTPKKMLASNMIIMDEKVFIVYTSKKLEILKQIDVTAGIDKDIELSVGGYSASAISFENFQVDEESKELYVFLNVIDKKSMDVYVLRYNLEGILEETINLSLETDLKLTSISGTYLRKGEYLYTGTYSSVKRAGNNTSEGIYIAKTTNGSIDFLKFYNFIDFDQFLSYLPQRKQDKIEKKKGKAEAKGKEYVISYLMASHNIRFIDGKFIYIGEAYYPTYRTVEYTTYVNGSMVTNTRTVFDGYQYTHATVAAFDIEGEKLWDVTFEMYPWSKPFSVIKFIRVTETSEREIGLMFTSLGNIKSKAISSDGEVLNEQEISMIETGNETDKVRFTNSNLTFWYNNYFLAHGFQTIKNKEEKEERGKVKRYVYFINKLSYSF